MKTKHRLFAILILALLAAALFPGCASDGSIDPRVISATRGAIDGYYGSPQPQPVPNVVVR